MGSPRRSHCLPEYPDYREEVPVISERATIALEVPSPYVVARHAARIGLPVQIEGQA